MQTLCSAPAKLIVSGEHSVVYGAPALSMAIALYAHCRCDYDENQSSGLSISLIDLQQNQSFNPIEWHAIGIEIETRFALFQQDALAIQNVLNTPFELIIAAVNLFDQEYGLKRGFWQLSIQSDIPIGRGLGSSAAIIVSVLKSLCYQHQTDISDTQLLALAKQVESRQHGRSSGLDPATSILGGLINFQQQCPTKLPLNQPPPLPLWLIDSGKPQSTTGQAVSHVRQSFADNQPLWQQFSETTKQITETWNLSHFQEVAQGLNRNQQLLSTLGVVPKKVEDFIAQLKTHHAAAKICGSGAIKGDACGVLLCFIDPYDQQNNLSQIQSLCMQHNYSLKPIQIDHRGVQCQTL